MATPLTVAVTGPTGTFGFGLMPLLDADERIGRVIGIARRAFDPAQHGWSKMEYRRGDVRDEKALAEAFEGADVVVHLAFLIASNAPAETIREVNVDGTLNAFRAAAAAGASRFVYASSVAAYGFHADNPIGMTETWPTRPARRMRYAQEKAQIEGLLNEADRASPDLELYVLRPPIVLGPHVVGGKQLLPGPLDRWGSRLASLLLPLRLPIPALVPAVPVQFIHEDDVGQAFLLCIVAAGPPGAYNITGDGVVTGAEVARELGVVAIPLPGAVPRTAARLATALPLPKQLQTDWIESVAQPAIIDATKAKQQLGWQPRYSSVEALRDTLRHLAP